MDLAVTYSLLKGCVPDAVEAAGMEDAAHVLRSSDPGDCASVTDALRALPERVRAAGRPPRCVDAVDECAFWAEAAVWAAAADDRVTFEYCVRKAESSVEEVWCSLELH